MRHGIKEKTINENGIILKQIPSVKKHLIRRMPLYYD